VNVTLHTPISFTGAGISNRVISKVRYGNISFNGIGASNIVERIGGVQGDIHFTGAGMSNRVTNSANRGSIYANLLHQQDQRQSYCPKHFY
jgi:RTX toxin RtxA